MTKNVATTKTIIEGSGIIGKGKGILNGNYEQVPMELLDYIELDLISHTDFVVYMKLLQFYNVEKGYAYPTITTLMIRTHIRSKATIHSSLNTLEEVGLIQKKRSNRGNNNYVVYKPLSKDEVYSLFPDKVEQLKEFETKLMNTAEHDKVRLQEYQLNNKEQQQQEQEIQAKRIAPKAEQPVNNNQNVMNDTDLLPEEIELLRKVELLNK